MPSHRSARSKRHKGAPSPEYLPGVPSWPLTGAVAGGGTLAATLALLCATPVLDTDLWFHMAYARQMLANGTLLLDHTAFSWTPSDNTVIYCAWVAQLLLHAIHGIGGLPALFVLRYGVFVLALGAVALYGYRLGVLRHPATWVVMVLALLMSSAAFAIKPQLASYALMTAAVLIWFVIRLGGRLAAPWCYALPVLMLLWVNTHGGFVVGLGFLTLAMVGELINMRFSPSRALSPAVRRHFAIALGLCFLAVFLTPYGWRYPAQFFTVSLPAIDLQAVRDYDSIFATSQRGLHYVEYGLIMGLLLLVLLVTQPHPGRIEWSLLLTNLAFALFYTYYVRLTFFWAPVALVSSLTLLAAGPRWAQPASRTATRAMGVAGVVVVLLLSAHALRSASMTPVVGGYSGFGIGYWNPEDEAEYIARHFPTARIGNDYNAGGYLIWRLWPGNTVFMDARYFPYRAWFQEYLGLENTKGIDTLLKRYPADLWCVELLLPKTVSWFRTSPDWVPAFYGASAVVFVRRGTPLPSGRLESSERIGEVRNLYQALSVLAFAFDARDLTGAARVVTGMERRFTAAHERPVVAGARTALNGVVAHARGDHALAVRLLAGVATAYQGVPAAAFLDSALLEANRLWQIGDSRGALTAIRQAVQLAPQHPLVRYNAGAIGWWSEQESSGRGDGLWRADLSAFLAIAGAGDTVLSPAMDSARAMIDGRGSGRPLVLVPPPPAPFTTP